MAAFIHSVRTREDLNDHDRIEQAVNIQFLSEGAIYTRLAAVTSGRALLELLPVRENTIVILLPDPHSELYNDEYGQLWASASGSASGSATMEQQRHYHAGPDQEFRQGQTWEEWRHHDVERLNHTESLPDNPGSRNRTITISSRDISDYLELHPHTRNGSLIDWFDSGENPSSLMILGQDDGVKLVIETDFPGEQPLFRIQGRAQLYNIDLEARLPAGSRLFKVDHSLQLYLTSITLQNPGKLFSGSGLVIASRSLLQENFQPEGAAPTDKCLMIRACRSEVALSDWQASPDERIAMNKDYYSYFEDYLDRAELLLPRKPRNIKTHSSPLPCKEAVSRVLITPNWYSRQTGIPAEFLPVLCPGAELPVEYTRAFELEQSVVSAVHWEAGNCSSGCGHLVSRTEEGTEISECITIPQQETPSTPPVFPATTCSRVATDSLNHALSSETAGPVPSSEMPEPVPSSEMPEPVPSSEVSAPVETARIFAWIKALSLSAAATAAFCVAVIYVHNHKVDK